MNIRNVIRAILLSPWTILKTLGLVVVAVLRTFRAGVRRVLFSMRVWVLFLLLVIAALVAYYVLEQRYTPFTADAYVQSYVVQVAPRVAQQVVGVYVQEDQAVKKGDLLFEIDRRPFQYRVDLLEAQRALAIQDVKQMESELAVARAEHARLVAEEEYASAVLGQDKVIYQQDADSERTYLNSILKRKAAEAARERAFAQIRKAEQALAARIGEVHARIVSVEAQLATARLDLEWTRVYAPANGYVTNFQLREGFYIHIGVPVLTLIESDRFWVVANYRETCLENIRPGQPVGLTLKTYPGRIFPARVQTVGWGVDQGQSAPSGNLPAIGEPRNWIRLAQRFQVWVIPDLPPEYPLRVGASGSAVVYTRKEYWLNRVTEFWQEIVARLHYLH